MGGLWSQLWSWIRRPLRTFSAPKPIDQMFAEMRGGSAPRAGRDEALSVPTVLKGRNLICSFATLPLIQLGPDNRRTRNPLFEQIDPNVPNVVTMTQTVEDLVFEAVAWWRVLALGSDGFPLYAQRIDPGSVSLTPPTGKTPSPLPSGEDPRRAVVYIDGKEVPFSEVIRFDSPNPGILKACGRAIKRAILIEQAASMYASDPRPADYFTPVDGADPGTDDEIAEILAEWQRQRRKRGTGYVPASLKYNTVDVPSPAELQLAQLAQRAALDIANALGVDPEDLGVSTTSRTYANVVDRRQDKINEALAPYMKAITDRLSMGDVTRRGYRVVFDLTDYMKSNPTERWNVYAQALDLGVMSVAEVRQAEGLPPIPVEAVPVSATPASVAASRRRELPQVSGVNGQVIDVTPSMITAGFSASTPGRRHTFALTTQEFSVDSQGRTIAGMALPWGTVGMKYGLRFKFRRGSLQWSEVGRVKHFKDHVTPVGRALDLTDAPAGLMTRLSVGAGPTGDELLQLAADEVYDGLSVGVEFDLDPAAGDVVLGKDGVYEVVRADLREISTTALPQFDDARVTKVAASRDGGTMDPCATCGQQHAPGTTCPAPTNPPAGQPATQPATVTLGSDQLAQLLTAGGWATLQPAQRQVVDPTRTTTTTLVREPAPYRFDRAGNLMAGSHDFSRDLIAGHRGDATAMDRALHWVQAQFDVATGDVNELNPARQRPEMWVDQKDHRYPVWQAISKGALTDITPFTFPKFNSAAGLVANHTEGVEPSSGTYTTTGQTVTPTAISGKAKITRETFDQGGNPQVSNLIWQQMLRGWYEALEAAAVALLDAATPAALGTFTAGGGAGKRTLSNEMEAALAALQFVRGGYRFTDGFAQVDLYQALAAAEDTSGRKLYPMINPANANGQAENRFGAILVGGTTFLPAWALAASGSVPASSYLFDRADVHGWASTPQRLEFNIEVAHVYIAIWGYRATAISDISGVREITYDPVA